MSRESRAQEICRSDEVKLMQMVCCGGGERTVPPEGFRCVGDHSDAQLDGLADRERQVLVAVTEICKETSARQLKQDAGGNFFGMLLPVKVTTYPEIAEVSPPSPAPERPGRPGFRPPARPAGQTDTGLTLLWTDQYWCWSEDRRIITYRNIKTNQRRELRECDAVSL